MRDWKNIYSREPENLSSSAVQFCKSLPKTHTEKVILKSPTETLLQHPTENPTQNPTENRTEKPCKPS
jgi:hypothetical protein